jgi:hypothetical protein
LIDAAYYKLKSEYCTVAVCKKGVIVTRECWQLEDFNSRNFWMFLKMDFPPLVFGNFNSADPCTDSECLPLEAEFTVDGDRATHFSFSLGLLVVNFGPPAKPSCDEYSTVDWDIVPA